MKDQHMTRTLSKATGAHGMILEAADICVREQVYNLLIGFVFRKRSQSYSLVHRFTAHTVSVIKDMTHVPAQRMYAGWAVNVRDRHKPIRFGDFKLSSELWAQLWPDVADCPHFTSIAIARLDMVIAGYACVEVND